MPTDPLATARSLLAQGNSAGAEKALRQLLAQQPHLMPARALLGNLLRREKRFADASAELLRAVELDPGQHSTWKDLALSALGSRDYEAADTASQRMLALAPQDGWTHFLRGHVLALRGLVPEAERHFSLAAQSTPATREARGDLALEAIALQQPQAARHHAEAAVRATPRSARAWGTLTEACIAADDFPAAVVAVRKALTLAPGDTALKRRYAHLLERTREDIDTLVRLRTELLALEPESPHALRRLGAALGRAKRWIDMHAVFKRLRAIEPDDLLARWMGFLIPPGTVYPDAAAMQSFRRRWLEGLAWFEALDLTQPHISAQLRAVLNSAPDYFLAYTGEADVELHRRYAQLVRRLVQAVDTTAECTARRIADGPRRIGVLSSHFRHGSVSRAWNEALLAIPDADLALHVFSTDRDIDDEAARLRDRAQGFHAEPREFGEWCATLREARLDVLVFLAVGMDTVVQALACLRHAPVQVATWGHPVTTGMSSIDYFLSGELAEPDDGDTHYSERLVRLPHLGGRFARPDAAVAPARTPSEGRFLCTQTLAKLHPGHDRLFARVAQACPGSTVTLLTHASDGADLAALRARLAPVLAEHGVEAARFRVLPMLDHVAYQAELSACDVVLDSLDFSGGLTSLDAFWHEKPVVTLPGKLMRGRQTLAMLRRMELLELAAADEDDYVRIAGELVHSAAYYRRITGILVQRKLRLFDDPAVELALKEFLRTVQP